MKDELALHCGMESTKSTGHRNGAMAYLLEVQSISKELADVKTLDRVFPVLA